MEVYNLKKLYTPILFVQTYYIKNYFLQVKSI